VVFLFYTNSIYKKTYSSIFIFKVITNKNKF